MLLRLAVCLGVLAAAALPAAAEAPVRIVFQTDWKAQAEHGGFYQALAGGLYAARGLEVEIRQGGPAINVPQLVAAGAVDFGMGSSSFMPLNLIAAGADVKAVMAVFQKDPQVLITHPRADVTSIADMKGKPIMVSDATISAFWLWLEAQYGFETSQIRKYTFNLAPFLVDASAIQQGYLSSEPYLIEREGGFAPQVFLLADAGYPAYSNLVLVPGSWIRERPDTVRAFVEATAEGWKTYLTGDRTKADALIREANPEMTQDVLDQAVAKLNAHGIVISGDAETRGIGAMTEARWAAFFAVMSGAGVYPADLDWRAAWTDEFLSSP